MVIQLVFTLVAYLQFSNLSEEGGYREFLQCKMKDEDEIPEMESRENGYQDTVFLETVQKKFKSSFKIQGIVNNNFRYVYKFVTLTVFESSFGCFMISILDLIVNMVCLYVLKYTLTQVGIAIFAGILLNAVIFSVTYMCLEDRINIYFTFCIASINAVDLLEFIASTVRGTYKNICGTSEYYNHHHDAYLVIQRFLCSVWSVNVI